MYKEVASQDSSLVGKRLLLRKIEQEDTGNIIRWRNQDFVRRNFIYQEPFTEKGHKEWLATMIESGLAVQFILLEKDAGRPIGSVYLRDIDRQHNKAEYGIFIGEADALSKGYGTEAAGLMLGYAFKELSLHKVFLRAFADNAAAVGSYKKAGFVQEALLRDEVRIQGQYRDMVLMACINPEHAGVLQQRSGKDHE